LARFIVPQTILLWSGEEIEYALEERCFGQSLVDKYHYCIENGLPDYNLLRQREIAIGKMAYVVVEDRFDAEILKRVLPQQVSEATEFTIGSGRYSAQSLARSLLAVGQTPVALVVDADTTDKSAICEQEDWLRESLQQASAGARFDVFLAEPEIEILLFESKEFVEELSPRSVSPTELSLARSDPKGFLARALGDRRVSDVLLRRLDDRAVAAMRGHPLIEGLNRFLSSVIGSTD
jgi:hypothetical protein